MSIDLSFLDDEINHILKGDLDTIAEDAIKMSDRMAFPAAVRSGFESLCLKNGRSTTNRRLTIYVPYNKKSKAHLKDVNHILEVSIFREIGLSCIYATGTLTIVHNGKTPCGLITLRNMETYLNFEMIGPKVLVSHVIDQLKLLLGNPPIVVNRIVPDNNPRNQSVLKEETIVLPDIYGEVPADVVYPFLDESPQELWEGFSKSRSNVVLLIGEPGLGKSTFLHHVLAVRGWDQKNIFIADRTDVLMHPGLSDYIRSLPRGSVVITEDSDQIVMSRQEGNPHMAALLNATAGIIPTDTKIMISTNLKSLNKVDEGILRPGRLYRLLEFKRLTQEQAHRVRQQLELPEVQFGDVRDLTLAEAINWHEIHGEIVKAGGVGFSAR